MPRPKKDAPPAKQPKRVTLQDIADIAGVNKMVVSNALNDTRSVAPATRERIKQIARDLNYVPNYAARALTTGRTGIVAVLIGGPSEYFYASMIDLLEQCTRADNFNLLLIRTPNEVKDLINATGNVRVDGAIAVDMLGLVQEFQSHSHIPCVSIATIKRDYVDNVITDLSSSVEEALRLMMANGRRRIAYLATGWTMAREAEVRAGTYYRVMRQEGREPEMIDVSTDILDVVGINFKAYIEQHGCPDALFCQNDETAITVFKVLRDSGYRVPDDVLLVGCDGQRHMRFFDPPLSTIVQPLEEMCIKAWQFLLRRIEQPNIPHQEAVFQGKLVVTRSLVPNASTGD
ncbi:LacI family transcriptional regulator [bacterium]|nr:MAG: LacI family transcriptional regulator [bacterium]